MNLESLYEREQVHRMVLDNGLTVILKQERQHALVSTQFWIKTGSIHEGRFLGSGISHYLEHMLFKGTASRSGRDIQQEVHQLGGYFNAYTSFDRTVYYIDAPSESALRSVEILSDMMQHPSFPQEEVERERQVILREIDMRDDDPDSVLSEKLFATAFRVHPYQYPIIGYKDLFTRLQREDLVEYYQSRYVPNNMILVMVGDFDPVRMEETIRALWSDTPRGFLKDVVIPEEPRATAKRALHDFGDYQITRGAQVFAIPGFSHPDSVPLRVLADIIGSGESSILWQELRQKRKLVHEVHAFAWNTGDSGLFYLDFTGDPEKRDAVLAAIPDVLEMVCQGKDLDETRVAQVVHKALAREIRSRVQVSGQAGVLGASECLTGDIHYGRNQLALLQKVTVDDVIRVARAWLNPETSLTLTLNPERARTSAKQKPGSTRGEVRVESGQWPNGLRWVVLPDSHLPLATVAYMGKGGCYRNPVGQEGIGHLTATLLAKGSRTRTEEQIVRAIEGVAGSFYGTAGNNTFSLVANCLTPDLDLACDLLAEGLTTPSFDEDTFELEREAQLSQLLEEQDDLVSWSLRELRRRFYGDHFYGISSLGTESGLQALKREQVAEQWSRLQAPDAGVLVFAGDIPDWSKRLEQMSRALAGLRQTTAVPAEKPWTLADWKGDAQPVLLKRERQQAIVMRAFPVWGICHENEAVDSVLVQMLSGMGSHLFERVREEKGLAYFVSANRLLAPDHGMLYFYAGTQPASATQVLHEYQAELERLASGGWSEQELNGAQAGLNAMLRMRQQNLSNRQTDAGLRALFGLPLVPWNGYEEKISRITKQDIALRAEMLLSGPSLSMIVEP